MLSSDTLLTSEWNDVVNQHLNSCTISHFFGLHVSSSFLDGCGQLWTDFMWDMTGVLPTWSYIRSQASDSSCNCGAKQTMNHIVRGCPVTHGLYTLQCTRKEQQVEESNRFVQAFSSCHMDYWNSLSCNTMDSLLPAVSVKCSSGKGSRIKENWKWKHTIIIYKTNKWW